MAIGTRCCGVLFVGPIPAPAAFATALEDRYPGMSLRFTGSISAAAEVMGSAPELILLSGRVDRGELARALPRARSLWGVRVPALVILRAEDLDEVASWYRLGVNCVLRVPGEPGRARRAAEAVLDYWLRVVALPGDA